MEIMIRTKDIELTEDLKSFVEKKIGSLEKLVEKATEIRVELAKETNHHKHGDIYRAAVEIEVPGKMLYSTESAEEIEMAINRVRTELQKVIEQHKGQKQAARRDAAKSSHEMKDNS